MFYNMKNILYILELTKKMFELTSNLLFLNYNNSGFFAREENPFFG